LKPLRREPRQNVVPFSWFPKPGFPQRRV
jgi:hypothetical protein